MSPPDPQARCAMPVYVIPGNHEAREVRAARVADGGYFPA